MEWLNIHASTLDSAEFVGSEPHQRATWLCLMRYCAGQENGGVIRACQGWTDRQWLQLCRVTQTEAAEACALWRWAGNDLSVVFYPAEREAEVQARRDAGRKGAAVRWHKPGDVSSEGTRGAPANGTPITSANGSPNSTPNGTAIVLPYAEGNGRGREEEREESPARTCAAGSTSGQQPVNNSPADTLSPPASPPPPATPTCRAPPNPPQRVFEHIPALDGPIAEFQGWWRDLTGHLGPTNPLAFLPFWSGVSDDPAVKPVWESACRDFAMAVISAVSPAPNEFSLHRLRNYVSRAVTTAARSSGRACQGEGTASAADVASVANDGRWKEARLAAANAIREARRVFGTGTIPKVEIARIGHVMRDKYGRIKLSNGDAEDAVAAGINWALNERPARSHMAQQAVA